MTFWITGPKRDVWDYRLLGQNVIAAGGGLRVRLPWQVNLKGVTRAILFSGESPSPARTRDSLRPSFESRRPARPARAVGLSRTQSEPAAGDHVLAHWQPPAQVSDWLLKKFWPSSQNCSRHMVR